MTDILEKMFLFIFRNGAFDGVQDALKLNPQSAFGGAWAFIEVIYNNVMKPVALSLMLIWFLVAVMEKSASEQVSFEQLFMLFAKLFAAWFLINNGLQIFADLWSLGISLIDKIASPLGSNDNKVEIPFLTEFLDNAKNGTTTGDLKPLWKNLTGVEWGNGEHPKDIGILTALGVMCQLLIPWVATLILVACAYFICYSRLIEMMVRMLAAPIALSDFMSEGLHGAGWRFLKNFLAICLQGALMAAICSLYPTIMTSVVTTSDDFWITTLKYIAISFSAIALMFKSLSLAKELVGTS